MNELEIIRRSKEYLDEEGIPYLDNPEIEVIDEKTVEITFLRPETLDPNIGIDPPDIIVSLNMETGELDIPYQF